MNHKQINQNNRHKNSAKTRLNKNQIRKKNKNIIRKRSKNNQKKINGWHSLPQNVAGGSLPASWKRCSCNWIIFPRFRGTKILKPTTYIWTKPPWLWIPANRFRGCSQHHTVDGRNLANQLRLVVYPIIYIQALKYVPGGARSVHNRFRTLSIKRISINRIPRECDIGSCFQ